MSIFAQTLKFNSMETGMWIRVILLLFAGVMASSAFIVSKKPDAKETLNKLVPYAGGVGVALFIFGILDFFGIGTGFSWFQTWKFPWGLFKIVMLLWPLVSIVLGFMQGYALIDKYVLNKVATKGDAGKSVDKVGDAAYEKIMKYSVPVGFTAIIIGLILLLYMLEIISPF